jgi:4-hydroxybenzoate polyprenyltransferase
MTELSTFRSEQVQSSHERNLKFRTAACEAAETKPRPPSLSDVLGMPPVDFGEQYKDRSRHARYLNRQPAGQMRLTARPVADATGNWVDTLAPLWARPYLRLARLDRPIGAWLLLLPCWWSSALAAMAAQRAGPSVLHLALFFVGAFAMRGAGCTWNDIVDRDLDRSVERTRSRPIPSGQVSVVQAAIFLAIQALIGLCVLICFNAFTIMLGAASLGLVAIYPYMKRITHWPQIVLGLAFSWGALMGWAAFFGRLDAPALLLYAGSIAWVIGYDTIYAHQDREDDALVGIKSTALLFGERTKPLLAVFYALAVIFIGAAGFAAGAGSVFFLLLLAFAGHLAWQIVRLDIGDPDRCLALFKSDRDAGSILFAAMVLDALTHHFA